MLDIFFYSDLIVMRICSLLLLSVSVSLLCLSSSLTLCLCLSYSISLSLSLHRLYPCMQRDLKVFFICLFASLSLPLLLSPLSSSLLSHCISYSLYLSPSITTSTLFVCSLCKVFSLHIHLFFCHRLYLFVIDFPMFHGVLSTIMSYLGRPYLYCPIRLRKTM